MAANFQGKWIITDGYAEVVASGNNLIAILRHSPDTDIYHHVDIQISDASTAVANVSSPREDVPSFSLQGTLYGDDEALTLLLPDGTTVLGLACGEQSCAGQHNLS